MNPPEDDEEDKEPKHRHFKDLNQVWYSYEHPKGGIFTKDELVYGIGKRPRERAVPREVPDEPTTRRRPIETPEDVEDGRRRGRGISIRALPPSKVVPLIPEKPTHDDLDAVGKEKVRLVEASKIAYKDGLDKAQEHLEGTGYEIDEELTNTEEGGLVVVKDGKAEVAYRGTDIENPKDLVKDGKILLGEDHIQPARDQLDLVEAKHGPVEEVSGFSLGGGTAIELASEKNITSHSFNPAVGKRAISTGSTGRHFINRTTEDPVSLGGRLGKLRHGWTVRSLLPHIDSVNPIEAHRLTNFTKSGPRRGGFIEDAQEEVKRTADTYAEADLTHAINESVKKGDNLEEFVEDFSRADMKDGKLSNRIHSKSKVVKIWKESGGKLPDSLPVGPDSPLASSRSLRDKVRVGGEKQVRRHHQRFIRAMDEMSEVSTAHINNTSKLTGEPVGNLARQVHPTTIGAGLGAGIVAGGLTEQALPDADPRVKAGISGTGAGLLLGETLPASASIGAGAVVSEELKEQIEKPQIAEPESKTREVLKGGAEGLAFAGTAGLVGEVLLGAGTALAPEIFLPALAVSGVIGGLSKLF